MRKIRINNSSKYKKIGNNLFVIEGYLIKIEEISNIIRNRCRKCDLNEMNCVTNNGDKFRSESALCFYFKSESKINSPMSRIYLRVINKENSLILNYYLNKLRKDEVI